MGVCSHSRLHLCVLLAAAQYWWGWGFVAWRVLGWGWGCWIWVWNWICGREVVRGLLWDVDERWCEDQMVQERGSINASVRCDTREAQSVFAMMAVSPHPPPPTSGPCQKTRADT